MLQCQIKPSIITFLSFYEMMRMSASKIRTAMVGLPTNCLYMTCGKRFEVLNIPRGSRMLLRVGKAKILRSWIWCCDKGAPLARPLISLLQLSPPPPSGGATFYFTFLQLSSHPFLSFHTHKLIPFWSENNYRFLFSHRLSFPKSRPLLIGE